MLLEFLQRDWYLHRRALLMVILIFSAFEVYFVLVANHPRMWLVFTCIYISFFVIVPMTRDDKFRAHAWASTLPVTRADLVRSRYVASWVIVALAFLPAFALAAFLPGSKLASALPVDPRSLLLAATVITIIFFLVIPFTARFGLMGVFIGLAAIQLIGAGLFVFASATGSFEAVEGGVAAVFKPPIAAVAAIRNSLPSIAFNIMALLTLVLINWLGYRFALMLFRRREF
ncbi:MAG: ABC-2 transporter permease [Gemmatimonadales bacterium]|jgi:hypothetical protein